MVAPTVAAVTVVGASDPSAANGAEVRPPAAGRRGPDYDPPDWAGKPGPPLAGAPLALELVVRGEVQKRIPLNIEEYDSFLVGRAKNCDVILDGLEPQSSRFHCIIQCKEGASEVFVYDLGSAHGTLLNGRTLAPRTFEPLRVGEQLRFCADKPTACIAVLCGPEDAMAEEGDIDLTAFREKAARDREALFKAQQADLQKRKDAKKLRMAKASYQQQVVSKLAEKARRQQKEVRAGDAAARAARQEVSWGMGEEAVNVPLHSYSEEAETLVGHDGRMDLEKVRKLKLTDKQEQFVAKAEQKRKRIDNLIHEKKRLEELVNARAQKEEQREYDIDGGEGPTRGGQNVEKLAGVETKLEKAEEDFSEMADNILLSLGFKVASERSMRVSKRKVAMYDTRNAEDEDDDYFDRTLVKKDLGPSKESKVPTELMGLPEFGGVETKASVEMKLGLLRAEHAQGSAQLAAERIKARQSASQAAEQDDELDSFMGSTIEEIRADRRGKLERRLAAVEVLVKEGRAMLKEALKNPEPPPLQKQPKPKPSPSPAAVAAVSAISAAEAGDAASELEGGGGAAAAPKEAAPPSAGPTGGSPKKRERGPRRAAAAPPVLGEASAAEVEAAGSSVEEVRPAGGGSSSSSAPAGEPQDVVAAAFARRALPPELRAKVEVGRGGLQVQPSTTRSAPATAMPPPSAMLPPAAKKRKVYGAAMPPPGYKPPALPAASDADPAAETSVAADGGAQ